MIARFRRGTFAFDAETVAGMADAVGQKCTARNGGDPGWPGVFAEFALAEDCDLKASAIAAGIINPLNITSQGGSPPETRT
jgi:hypothetical protein